MKTQLPKIYLSSPHMGGMEQKYIQEAFDANWIAPMGENITEFEKSLQCYFNNEVQIAVLNSGTAAIHLGLKLLGVTAGDEVLCQSLTFVASANPILYLGAAPVFIDSEAETWNMCPKALEEAIVDRMEKGKKPKAIVTVHLYGMPYKVEEINVIAKKYNIPVLEDSAEALGSRYKGRLAGTLGAIGVLSFNGNKVITTSGGGAVVCHSQELKEKAVFYATQSRDAAPHYQHSEVGYNYRMSNISAGIGRGQMEVLDRNIGLRRGMHAFYNDFFNNIEGVTMHEAPSDDIYSNYWLSAILMNPKKCSGRTREELRLALEAANIESRPLWKPMHLQPVFAGCPFYGGEVAESLFENGLCLPSGSNLNDADRARIAAAMQEFFA